MPRAIRYDHQLWEQPENWPYDPPGYRFLARAFLALGKAHYREKWMDRYTEPDGEPDEAIDDENYDDAWEEWERKCQEAEAAFQEMWHDITRIFAQHCREGALITAVRNKAGGAITELDPKFWYTEKFANRFFRCEMSHNNPFSERYPPNEAHWIYVQEKRFQHVLANNEDITINMGRRPIRDHLLRRTKRVIVELFGFPPRLNCGAKQRNEKIRKKLGKPVSNATIRRAFQRIRSRNNS
jgi:hypothetical protein